ncbi:MAG: DUF3108 domain-containing protein [Verrucomicrobiales bacterium]
MKIPLSLFALPLVCAVAPASAQGEGPPEWMENITRVPPGDHANLRSVALEYTLSWNNRINAGRVEMSVDRSGSNKGKFVGNATGKSTGFARVLWPYDFRARSIVDEDSLRPLAFQLSERERNESNAYDIIFEPNRQLFTTTSTKKNNETETAKSRFKFGFGHDVLSSAFYLRSQKLDQGDELSMVVSPFNKPYLAEFKVLGREKHKVKGKTYDAIKLDAEVGKINSDLTIKSYDKIKRSTLWITNDEYRIPLELQTHIAVGFISARLDDLKWLE